MDWIIYIYIATRRRTIDAMRYAAARSVLARTMKKVCEDHPPMIITRKKASAMVMLSLEDLEALQETACLLGAPGNAHRLLGSMAQLRL